MADATAIEAAEWQGHSPEEWAREWGAPRVVVFRRAGSTNDEARALAEQGAPPGTVVIADEQTRGRGQHGRTWTARPGHALLLSIILDPRQAGGAAVLPLRVGLAAARAIEAAATIDVRIKWPNDLVVRGRKIGGILCEAALQGGRPLHLVAGIGINIRQTDDDWPADLRGRATSVRAEARGDIDTPGLAGRLVRGVRAATAAAGAADAAAADRLSGQELDDLARRDALRGHAVLLDGRPAGTAHGVTDDGALIIRGEDGGTRHVRAGTVRVDEPRSEP